MNQASPHARSEGPEKKVAPSVWRIFISHRRSALTREIGLWLKKELESEPIESTTGQVFKLDVFLDIAESHQTDFEANLVPYLKHSRALILLTDDSAAARRQHTPKDYLYQELDW